MKKYFYLFMSLLVLSCSTEDDFIENPESEVTKNEIVAKNSNPVKLVKAWKSFGSYRGYTSYYHKFAVEVANLAYDKSVSIYHEKKDGSWDEIVLSYNTTIDNQTELWTGEYSQGGYGITEEYDDEFVIKYVVNGSTYWDNNFGANYRMDNQEGYLFAKSDLNVSVDTDFVSLSYAPYDNKNTFNITVDVRNLSPDKEVGVVYSSDGWQTQKYAPLAFRSTWTNGPFYSIQSPNNYNVERWQGYATLDASEDQVEYAVVYSVNGDEYWDNNYGNNYTVTINSYN
ncbi:hypothetical protein D1818_11800 [Aquimarina sp. BL5]|uniref:carbohydrate-binding protein n=1 Tax=Aquimarina sp. BL5 TaxID=1714860 RepID=UPI000E52CEFE|nr:carbohydrate-binding protein [Aquimarina sp. BL5]AXT51484.1 hypothetical protein D1818_11800 [Aquimarina sp. BL5]RKN03017.1 hypothetical protein D7036_14990 [Aquimarina sp. BL5]